jgi:type I restriction enzyme S subunit
VGRGGGEAGVAEMVADSSFPLPLAPSRQGRGDEVAESSPLDKGGAGGISEPPARYNPIPKTPLDQQYELLKKSEPAQLDRLLSALDPRNSLELDLARQFLTALTPDTLAAYPHLQTLNEIISSVAKYPRVKLSELLEPRYEKIKKTAYDGVLPLVEKISFADGKLHFREDLETGMDLYRASKGDLVTSKINIHQGAVALAPYNLAASTHYQMYAVRTDDVMPEFLLSLLRSKQFSDLISLQKNKGIKNEQGSDFIGEFEIPLPLLEEQQAIVTEIDRQRAIIAGAEMVLENWRIDKSVFDECKQVRLGDVANIVRGKFSHRPRNDPEFYDGFHPFIQINDITTDFKLVKKYSQSLNEKGLGVSKYFPEGTLVMSIASSIGEVGILGFDACFPDSIVAVNPYCDAELATDYLFWYFKCFKNKLKALATQAVQANINNEKLEKLTIHYPENTVEMQRITSRLNEQLDGLEYLKSMKEDASTKITTIITKIWEH